MKEEKGLLYFAQNSAFQHLTKIGKTTKLQVEDRGLSASNVPEDFDYLAVLECENVSWAEKKVHEQFNQFRHYSKTGRSTEFFWSGCIKDAIKYAKDLKGVQDETEEEIETITDDDGNINDDGKQIRSKRPRITFKELGISVGEELEFYYPLGSKFNGVPYDGSKNGAKFKVVDEKTTLEYQGKKYAWSVLAALIMECPNKSVAGISFYKYKGEYTIDLYNRLKAEEKAKQCEDNL